MALEGESIYSVLNYQTDINSEWISTNFSQDTIEIIKKLVDAAEFDSENSIFISSRKGKVICSRPWGGNNATEDNLLLLETSDSYVLVENLRQIDKYCYRKIVTAGKTEICDEKQLQLFVGQIVRQWYWRGRYKVFEGYTTITLISNGNRSYDLIKQLWGNSETVHISCDWFELPYDKFLKKLLTLFPEYAVKTELAYFDTLEKLRRKPGLDKFLGFESNHEYIPVRNMEPGTWGHVTEPAFVISQNQSLNNKMPHTDYAFCEIEEAAAYSKTEVIVRNGISEWSKERKFMTSLFVTNCYPNKSWGITEGVYIDERDNLPYFIVLQHDGQMCAQTWYLDKVQLTYPDVAELAKEKSEELYEKFKDINQENCDRFIQKVDYEKIQKIVGRIDFSYDREKHVDVWGWRVLDGVCRGSGPYHEEGKLFLLDEKDKYIFAEETKAPMSGCFSWKILTVNKSEINNDKEESLLIRQVSEKWMEREG